MNPLKELITIFLKSRGISKKDLVESIGYKNIGKGHNRLDEFLENGRCINPDIVERIPVVLGIPKETYRNAVELLQKAKQDEFHRLQRQKFHPHIRIFLFKPIRPLFIMAMTPSLFSIDVPYHIQDLPEKKEFKVVFDAFNENDQNHNGFCSHGNCRGFRYYRTYDEWFEFDIHGKVTGSGTDHPPRGEAFLSVGGRRIPQFFWSR